MINPTTRRERERLARRRDIVDAARRIFAEKGFNEATLDDVAVRAEFGKGTLYNYFSNKFDLFKTVLEESFVEVLDAARRTMDADTPLEERLAQFVRGALTYFFRNPETIVLMMRESHHLRVGNPMMQLMPQLLHLLADTLAAEQRRKHIIAKANPMALAAIVISMVWGQFNARVMPRAAAGGPCAFPTDIIGQMSEEEITREIEEATALVTTVFFNGVSR